MKNSKPLLAYERVYADLDEIMPIMMEYFDSGKSVRLPIRGTSMLPLLREGRDSVIIERPIVDPRRGDIVLYRRESGDYVLHRIIAVRGDRYTMCGDNQHVVERGVPRENIIAVVTSYFKGEREMRITSFAYRLYRAQRTFIRRAKNLVYRIKRRFFKSGSASDKDQTVC